MKKGLLVELSVRQRTHERGHASITLTLDVYSHVLPTMQEAASQKMEGILFG